MAKLIGVINRHDGYFYGTTLLSGDVPASIQAAAGEWDGGDYAYVEAEDPREADWMAYLLPDDWNDADHRDGQNRDTIEAVKAGRLVGECDAFNRQDDRYGDDVRMAALLRRSIEVEDGHRVDIEVDPDIDFMVEDGDRLATITVRIAGTWFDGVRTLQASEWIDANGDFVTVDSHFDCNDRSVWRGDGTGPRFEDDAWKAVKEIVGTLDLTLVEEEVEEDENA